jgi:predicted enzyme related to lactoylglutathione lyase
MTYRLRVVRVFAADWDAMTAFYRDTLGLPEKFSDAEMGWAEFDVGGPSLAVERIDPEDDEAEGLMGRFLGVSLAVDDVQREYRRLVDAGVTFAGPPAAQPWGGVLAHLEDPEGNGITLLGLPDASD